MVTYVERFVARVRGAGVGIVAVDRRSRSATQNRIARLHAVAIQGIDAIDGNVVALIRRLVAGISRTQTGIVAVDHGTDLAESPDAAFRTVAKHTVVALRVGAA